MYYFLFFILFIIAFLTGMAILRIGLFNISGEKLKIWLEKLTYSPLLGLLAGTGVTAVLQSSSAVMVITIGLIAANVLSFRQSIGIILGTNIGTTFTAEFIAVDLESYTFPIFLIGMAVLFLPNFFARSIGFIFIGISLIFSAMAGFENLAAPFSTLSLAGKALNYLNSHRIESLLAGVVVTAIIQSSTAATGIIMGFLSANILSIETGIAMMLGANIGTCATALIAAVGSGKEARLCAYAHVWLNVLGAMLFFPFIEMLSYAASQIAKQPDVQLAHASVIFNVLVSLLVLPFAEKFGSFIIRMHGKNG